MIKESECWHNRWKNLKLLGIDGFNKGFLPHMNPGPTTFDIVCDLCHKLIAEDFNGNHIKLINNHLENHHGPSKT